MKWELLRAGTQCWAAAAVFNAAFEWGSFNWPYACKAISWYFAVAAPVILVFAFIQFMDDATKDKKD